MSQFARCTLSLNESGLKAILAPRCGKKHHFLSNWVEILYQNAHGAAVTLYFFGVPYLCYEPVLVSHMSPDRQTGRPRPLAKNNTKTPGKVRKCTKKKLIPPLPGCGINSGDGNNIASNTSLQRCP